MYHCHNKNKTNTAVCIFNTLENHPGKKPRQTPHQGDLPVACGHVKKVPPITGPWGRANWNISEPPPHTRGNALNPGHRQHQILAPAWSHGNSHPCLWECSVSPWKTVRGRGTMVCVSVWALERERDAGPREGQQRTAGCFFCGEHVSPQHPPHFIETEPYTTWLCGSSLPSVWWLQGSSVVWPGSGLHSFSRPNNVPFCGHATF